MRRNVAGQFVGAQMITAADGTAFTGSVTVYVTGDAGTQAVGSVGSGACTHEGNGFHSYAPAQAETNYTHVAYTFIGTGAIPATVQIYPTAYDANGRADLGAISGSAISTTTAQLGVNVVQISADATAADNAEAFFDGTGYAGTNNVIPSVTTVTGNVNGSVGSVTGAVGSVTGAVGSVTGNVGGNVVGSVASVTAAVTTALDGLLMHSGTAQAGADTSITLASSAEATDNGAYVGGFVVLTGGTGAGQVRRIDAYTASTRVASNDGDWSTNPDATTTYSIFGAQYSVYLRSMGSPTTVLAAPGVGNRLAVDVQAVSGDTTAADNAESFFDGTGYAGTNNVIPTVTTLTGHTAQTGDSYARLGAPAGASISADIAALPTAAEVNAEVVDALATDTYAEPTGVPGATVSLAEKIGRLYMALRNQVTVTATKKTYFDDSGSAEWEKDLSDDGTTYTETEGNAI